MSILLILHSINRYLVTLVAIVLIVRLIIGLIRKQAFDKGVAGLTRAFSGLMDIQMLLGILFFVLDGIAKTGFPLYRWEHVISMVLAVSAAHLPARWKTSEDSVRTRNTLIAVSVSLLFIFIGVSALGVARWWHITGWF